MAYDLLLCNMYPKKRNSHLITYRSGNTDCTILFHKSLSKLVTDVMVIAGQEVALQRQLVSDMLIDMLFQINYVSFTYISEENLIRRIRSDLTTSMSPPYLGMDANKAIDFDDRTQPNICDCCSATLNGDAWWKLDLGNIYPITSVIFIGRSDGT